MQKHRKHRARKGIGYRVTVGLLLILSMILTQGNFVKAAGTASSDNLNEFTKSVSINAPQENGKYTVKKGSQYEITLAFAETKNKQFADSELTYTLPSGFSAVSQTFEPFTITVTEGAEYPVKGNTVTMDNGQLKINFNKNDPNYPYLQRAGNTQFTLDLKGTFDDSAKELDWGNNQKTSLNVDTNGSLTTTKTANYDPNDGKVHYTVTVQSNGYNENVKVADSLAGTALTYDRNVKEQNSSLGSVSDEGDHGFKYTIPEMKDGQTVTLTYTASVDFDALGGGTGTAEQVGNSVTTTSDQQKKSEPVKENWSNRINYLSIAKQAGTTTDGKTSGHKTIPWTVTYNANPKGSAAGRTITDSIADDSKDILSYSGDGITIEVKDASGTTIRTDNVKWSTIKQSDSSWSYQIPAKDQGKAYSYTVTYTTDADTSGIVTDKTVNNTVHDDKNHSANASQGIQPGPDNKIAVTKTAGAADNQKISWTVTLTVPKAGLKTAQVIDKLPTQYVDNQNMYDIWDAANVKVEGLLDGETMVQDKAASDQTKAVYTFYQDKAHTKTGLKASDNKRNITITFDTKVNQDWLDKADQSYMMTHKNTVDFVGNGSTVTASADKEVVKQEIKKSMDQTKTVTIDGKTYPAWQYTITLKGAQAQDFNVTDTFDSRLRYVNPNEISGLDSGRLSDTYNNSPWNASPLAATVSNGKVVFNVKQADIQKIIDNQGNINELHIRYWLIAKDPTKLMQDAANNQDGKTTLSNKATWAGNNASVNADYKYPGLSKKLLTDQSKLNTTDGSQPVATYELDANPAGAKIGEGKTVVVTDTMSANQVLNPQSVQMTPSAGTSFKVEKGDDGRQVITFTIPNETAVKIVYSATVTGGKGSQNLSNTAEMAGYKAESNSSASKSSSSGGSASNYSLTVFKHKEGDLTTKLAGCTFELHDADPDADKDWKGSGQQFTTGQDGSVVIKSNTSEWFLSEDTLYYLIETKAPDGYQLDQTKHYFKFSSDGTQDTSKNIYMNGATLSVGDKPTSTTPDKGSLEIVKTTNGGTTPGDTTFTITGPNGYSRTVKYSELTNGSITIDNLPVGDYTVKESKADVNGYTLKVRR